jgi:hypothetical protein
VIGFHVKINLYQFVANLNGALRYMVKYFPNKAMMEYTAAMAGLAPDVPQEIDSLNLTQLDFLDINNCWQDIISKQDISFIRRGEYLVFNKENREVMTDF